MAGAGLGAGWATGRWNAAGTGGDGGDAKGAAVVAPTQSPATLPYLKSVQFVVEDPVKIIDFGLIALLSLHSFEIADGGCHGQHNDSEP